MPHYPVNEVKLRERLGIEQPKVSQTESTIFDESRDLTSKIQALNQNRENMSIHINQSNLNATNPEMNILAMSGMSPMSSEFHPTSEFNKDAFNGSHHSDNIAAKLEKFRHELKKSSEAVEQLRKRTKDLSEEKQLTPRNLETCTDKISKNLFSKVSNMTGGLSYQLVPISDRSNATSNFGVTKAGDPEGLRDSGNRTSFDMFRPESFSLETTTDKNMFCYSKHNSQSLLSMKMDKYEAANPVAEHPTLESRVESRCESTRKTGGIATELVPMVAAQDKREFRQFEIAYKKQIRRQSSVDSFK